MVNAKKLFKKITRKKSERELEEELRKEKKKLKIQKLKREVLGAKVRRVKESIPVQLAGRALKGARGIRALPSREFEFSPGFAFDEPRRKKGKKRRGFSLDDVFG